MLTGAPVLTEVLAGRLSVDHALADGMMFMMFMYGNESE